MNLVHALNQEVDHTDFKEANFTNFCVLDALVFVKTGVVDMAKVASEVDPSFRVQFERNFANRFLHWCTNVCFGQIVFVLGKRILYYLLIELNLKLDKSFHAGLFFSHLLSY
jgi:hypothetical protein